MWRWIVLLLILASFFAGLTSMGLTGPDEPRYAAIGREMARSGDWITPRLWGQPWFEKPPLLYWMTAAAFRLGLNEDLAPRLPVALTAVAFLLFFFWILRREFGENAAWFATIILGATALWLAFSQTAVTDLPMSAAFSAAMLLSLGWVDRGEQARLPLIGLLLGVAVLAKGLVPLVLALPLLRAGRKHAADLFRPQLLAPFFAVTIPWHALCYARNGREFLTVFFLQHHLERFTSPALQHVQPFWFYLPVIAAALFPWTALLVLLFRKSLYQDRRCQFLLLWVIFGMIFFSASANKLPGYILPLIPALAALLGIAVGRAVSPALLAFCAIPLAALPAIAGLLPHALASGLSRSPWPQPQWWWLLFLLLVPTVWYLTRAAAIGVIAACMIAGVLWIKFAALPAADREASARPLWREISGRESRVCAGTIGRSWRYGLNYYSVNPLPDCSQSPRPIQVTQLPGHPAHLTLSPPAL